MLATVQRVSSAEIVIDGEIFTSIGDGCLMFVCVEKDDVSQNINNMVNKLLNFRMLDGPKGITSSPLNNSGKEVLIVSQFTLAAITNKGRTTDCIPTLKPVIITVAGPVSPDFAILPTGEFSVSPPV